MLDLLIIGGGIHGTYLSHVLSARMGISELAVVDPFAEPLSVWYRHTRACGMRYLRSPGSHNLDLDFRALRDYAARHGRDRQRAFIPPYARPLLELFNEHARFVIRENNLLRRRRLGTVHTIVLHDDHVEVSTEHEHLRARFALLATGRGGALCYPAWSRRLNAGVDTVDHILSPSFRRERLLQAANPVIIGAGASGIQLALATNAQSGAPVTVISEHPVRVRRFDSDPCFIGPRCARAFLAETDYRVRRSMIDTARAPGTVPEEVGQLLSARRREGAIRVIEASVQSASADGGSVRLRLSTGSGIESDCVTIATGFAADSPGSGLAAQLAARYNLPLAEGGFPVPDAFLRWHPRLFVTGTLAELELGPFAPNIIGAIAAAKRLGAFFLELKEPLSRHWAPLSRLWDDSQSA